MTYDHQKLFSKIDKKVSANPRIQLKDLTQQLRCSHPVIENAIIKSTKLSFRDFKNYKILEHSINLWSQGYSVKTIALAVGYKWPDNFSRFFKQKTGLSLSKLSRNQTKRSNVFQKI